MTEEAKKKKERRYVAGGLVFTAGLFIGMGVGWALGNLVPGMFIGMGAGFLFFGIIDLTPELAHPGLESPRLFQHTPSG
jgi:hypothetical protein